MYISQGPLGNRRHSFLKGRMKRILIMIVWARLREIIRSGECHVVLGRGSREPSASQQGPREGRCSEPSEGCHFRRGLPDRSCGKAWTTVRQTWQGGIQEKNVPSSFCSCPSIFCWCLVLAKFNGKSEGRGARLMLSIEVSLLGN